MRYELSRSKDLKISDGYLMQYTGVSSDLVIAEPITGIASGVFLDNKVLNSAILPEGLEVIENHCFENCSHLTSVYIPFSVNKLGEYAFSRCTELKNVKLPYGLKKIEAYTFRECHALTSIDIPDSVTAIGIGAFSDCSNLTRVTIPESVTDFTSFFDQHPFHGCSKLTIHTPAGSSAHRFAVRNHIPCVTSGTGSLMVGTPAQSVREEIPEKPEPAPVAETPAPEAPAAETPVVEKQPSRAEIRRAEKAAAKARAEEEKQRRAEEKRRAQEAKAAEDAPVKSEKPAGRKPSALVAALLVIILLGILGFAGFKVYQNGLVEPKTSETETVEDEPKPEAYTLTLEDFIKNNETARKQILQSTDGTSVDVAVKDNTLVYTYDLSANDSMSEDDAKSDELKQVLEENLDTNDDRFIQLCDGLEQDTGIKGISVEVIYAYGDDILLSRQYTSGGKQ